MKPEKLKTIHLDGQIYRVYPRKPGKCCGWTMSSQFGREVRCLRKSRPDRETVSDDGKLVLEFCWQHGPKHIHQEKRALAKFADEDLLVELRRRPKHVRLEALMDLINDLDDLVQYVRRRT